jgi:hypothetical protein
MHQHARLHKNPMEDKKKKEISSHKSKEVDMNQYRIKAIIV